MSARAKAGGRTEAAKPALEAALLRVADDLDIRPRKVRPAVRRLLASLDAVGVSAGEA